MIFLMKNYHTNTRQKPELAENEQVPSVSNFEIKKVGEIPTCKSQKIFCMCRIADFCTRRANG